MRFDSDLVNKLKSNSEGFNTLSDGLYFNKRNLSDFKTDIEAYHQLMIDLVKMQFLSTSLVIDRSAMKRIFVDGGFSKNNVFMNLLRSEEHTSELQSRENLVCRLLLRKK